MRHAFAAVLLCCAAFAHAQTPPPAAAAPGASAAKKELVTKVLQLQQSSIDAMARQLAQAPVIQLMQQANQALQTQVPADKREALAKTIETDARKFVEEAVPVIRERAIKLAPTTIGVLMEEKFSEEELKQLIVWMESPVIRKYRQLAPEMQNAMVGKLMTESAPVLDPKLKALGQRMRAAFENATAPASAPSAKPAPKAASK
jgi:hypothetical protein